MFECITTWRSIKKVRRNFFIFVYFLILGIYWFWFLHQAFSILYNLLMSKHHGGHAICWYTTHLFIFWMFLSYLLGRYVLCCISNLSFWSDGFSVLNSANKAYHHMIKKVEWNENIFSQNRRKKDAKKFVKIKIRK